MKKQKNTRGFVTLAVGNEKYYKLAANLLKSYRFHIKEQYPFAIYCDRENEYTKLFDKVIILNNPTCTYLDKLMMFKKAAFDENIFIDADCLVYGDINLYWEYMPEKGISCFGKSLPLDSHDGWFEKEDIGEYKEQVNFIPQMHGGIIFFRNDKYALNIYELALKIAENYHQYKFKYFSEPADEPLLALSMAVNGIRPIEVAADKQKKMFLFYPTVQKIHCNINRGILEFSNDGSDWEKNVLLCHWQNVFTNTPIYSKEILRLEKCEKGICKNGIGYIDYLLHLFMYQSKKWIRKVKNIIKNVI